MAHALTTEAALTDLGVDAHTGLSESEVKARQEKYGSNELDKEEATPLWKLVLAQFDDLLVKILLGAALLSFVLACFEDGEEGITAFVEPFVILLILIINAIVGVWQESNAENALEALKEMQSSHCNCLRAGAYIHDLSAQELVPGDIVDIRVGDKVPADCRILKLKTTTIRTDEGALTGESATVMKHTDPVAEKVKIQEKRNMMFAGTTVANGAATVLITQIGMSTEIGKIQSDVQAAKEDEEKTPLGQKLDDFGEMLTKVIAAICLLVWVMNYKQFSDPVHGGMFKGCIYYMKIAVALGVAAIPEGLPAVITLCLALGTRKMVKKNCIIRKLPSVETLGCTTVICSDKTGTLTTNQMTAVAMMYLNKPDDVVEHVVTGTSYDPAGTVQNLQAKSKGIMDFAKVCSLCNEAEITYNADKDLYERIGEPTEAALKVLVEKIGTPDLGAAKDKASACKQANESWNSQYTKQAILEFSRDRKSMSVICSTGGAPAGGRALRSAAKAGGNQLFVKGAPESVIKRCTQLRLADGSTIPMTPAAMKNILSYVDDMAKRPLRCLAMALKEDLGPLADYTEENMATHKAKAMLSDPEKFVDVEQGLVFLGVVGIKDPARPEVKPSIQQCRDAGIRVIMITGDTKVTAEAIATEIGIFEEGQDISKRSFTGADFFDMPDAERRSILSQKGSFVFSRTEPRDKQALVKILREMGEVPAMTGDGVNDAPALKQAAIGVAMGIAGTEVAKEASDMVLADDNFATIVHAVEEGRAIYSNMKAFIRYLISSNIGEVASIFLTALTGMPEGLIPVQLLWVNLVTDGPPATALGFNPPDADIMKKPPRGKDDQLIGPWVYFRYMVVGMYVGFATVGVFAYWYLFYDWAGDGHSLITYDQLTHWGHCTEWTDFKVNDYGGMSFQERPCEYFGKGKVVASTLSLSVLVTIEMFNALNALSEDGSLVQMPPWVNPWLLLAMAVSFGLHFVILYIPFLASIFSIVPLTWNDWIVVLVFSFPVIIIDEILKFFGRQMNAADLAKRKKEQ